MIRCVAIGALSILAFSGLSAFMLFSPWGIHIYGEVLFPEDVPKEFEATNYPTVVVQTGIERTIPLPVEVTQPSGIDYDELYDRFLVVTDQAEIIELSGDLQTLITSKVMSNVPLFFRQGTIESNDLRQGSLFVGGDTGAIEIWAKKDGRWQREDKIEASAPVELSSEGIAIDPETGHIYMGGENKIHVLDNTGKYLETLELKGEAKPGRSISEYIVAGLDFYGGDLFVLTEYYSAILTVNPQSGQIKSIQGLSGIVEGAGLAVTENSFFVVVDHEVTEPSPGVKVYRRLIN